MSNVPQRRSAAVRLSTAVVGRSPPKDARSRRDVFRRIRTLKESPSTAVPKSSRILRADGLPTNCGSPGRFQWRWRSRTSN